MMYLVRRFSAVFGLALALAGTLLVLTYGSKVQSVQAETEGAKAPLCRFGVNVLGSPDPFDVGALRMGWYVDYGATSNPSRPNGAHYMPIIGLEQIGDSDYDYSPKGAALAETIATNPGAIWFIGNEPDRPEYQDDLLPEIYADAYHELYYLIKDADPTAQIVAGTIVQPTPVRLLYLDMVLESYRESYGERLPTDGWSVHNFILNEVSCEYDLSNCWGAEIPPGIDWPYGEIIGVDENDSIERFQERIWRFRQWMRDRGYRGLPLYVSEYGILMPPDYGYPAERVNAFMNSTFDFMATTTDPALGDPNDEYRLVQRWSWYSSHDRAYVNGNYNGWLFDPTTHQLSAMGHNYADYTGAIQEEDDLYPSRIFADPHAPHSDGQAVTFTLKATIANGGNAVTQTSSAIVRFYDGNPQQGGTQIGSDQTVQLWGCGDNATVSVTWNDVPPGAHEVYVTVDPANNISESDEQNNLKQQTILVATEHLYLPATLHH